MQYKKMISLIMLVAGLGLAVALLAYVPALSASSASVYDAATPAVKSLYHDVNSRLDAKDHPPNSAECSARTHPGQDLPAASSYRRSSEFSLLPGNTYSNGIAFADGKLWVVDSLGSRVYAYGPDGTYYPESGFVLTAENSNPTGIAFADGKFWVADYRDDRVYTYGPDGTHYPELGFALAAANGYAGGITFADGKFWAVNFYEDRKVYAYGLDGTHYPELGFETYMQRPNGIAFADEKLWVVDEYDDKINTYGLDGTQYVEYGFALYGTLFESNSYSTGITFADGRLWVVEYNGGSWGEFGARLLNMVHVYNIDGSYDKESRFPQYGGNARPAGITFADGKMWITEQSDSRVYVYDQDGMPRPELGFGVYSPINSRITFADGKLWVVGAVTSPRDEGTVFYFGHMVLAYGLDGTHYPELGFRPHPDNDRHVGITLADGKLWILNWGDDKVYVYGLDGTHYPELGFALADDVVGITPTGIEFANGKLWVTRDGRAYAYGLDGTHYPELDFVTVTGSANPEGITSVGDALWTVNSNCIVYKYTPSDSSSSDTIPPTFDSAAYDKSTGMLSITFSESIDNSNVSLSKLDIRESGYSVGGANLSGSTIQSSDAAALAIVLSESKKNTVNSMASPQLDISAGAVRDLSGNTIAAAPDRPITVSSSSGDDPRAIIVELRAMINSLATKINNLDTTISDLTARVAALEAGGGAPPPSTTGVRGKVYTDTNNNNRLDPGEIGQPNRIVALYNRDTATTANLATNSNGDYSAEAIPGNYLISVQFGGPNAYAYITIPNDTMLVQNLAN